MTSLDEIPALRRWMPSTARPRLVGLKLNTYRYAWKRPDDGALHERPKGLAVEPLRSDSRRLLLLLRRDALN